MNPSTVTNDRTLSVTRDAPLARLVAQVAQCCIECPGTRQLTEQPYQHRI
jgi:hypothetical protein